MAIVTFKNEIKVTTAGNLPSVGSKAPYFCGVRADLSEAVPGDYAGKRVILNIFPSVDTGICAASVRRFNKESAELENTAVLCVSKDLPFAQARFCGAEELKNVETLSAFRCNCFDGDYGLRMEDGPLKGLLARAVVIIDPDGTVVYTELVPEITVEPDYEAALAALK